MKPGGPSARNVEMFLLGGAVGLIIEVILRGEKTCPSCPVCNAGITSIVPLQETLAPVHPMEIPR